MINLHNDSSVPSVEKQRVLLLYLSKISSSARLNNLSMFDEHSLFISLISLFLTNSGSISSLAGTLFNKTIFWPVSQSGRGRMCVHARPQFPLRKSITSNFVCEVESRNHHKATSPRESARAHDDERTHRLVGTNPISPSHAQKLAGSVADPAGAGAERGLPVVRAAIHAPPDADAVADEEQREAGQHRAPARGVVDRARRIRRVPVPRGVCRLLVPAALISEAGLPLAGVRLRRLQWCGVSGQRQRRHRGLGRRSCRCTPRIRRPRYILFGARGL